ncbi:hypothetical protein HanIR_Chr04g0202901 [Helianthus annuus]|nr:hypothetical protein HanIR_Chr04g0202901 [Helianthus annuus]
MSPPPFLLLGLGLLVCGSGRVEMERVKRKKMKRKGMMKVFMVSITFGWWVMRVVFMVGWVDNMHLRGSAM